MQTSAERWTRITDILQSMGLLVKIKGRGSYIRQPYRTVGGLYQAVTSGKLRVPPLPTGNVRQYWAQNGEQNRTEAQDE
jgi:hypothetical protein